MRDAFQLVGSAVLSTLLAGTLACGPRSGAPSGTRNLDNLSDGRPGLIEKHSFGGKGGLIVLETRVNGSAALPFIFDSGARPCVLDPLTTKRLQIAEGSVTRGQGGAGTFESREVKEPVTLIVGSEQISCARTIVADLAHLGDVLGTKPAGLIGADFFRGRVIHIDYDRHELTTYEPQKYPVPSGPNVLPIRAQDSELHMKIRLWVNGGPQGVERELRIDLGSLDMVDDPLLEEGKGGLERVEASGLGQGFRGSVGTWQKIQIGPYTFHNVRGVVPNVPIVGAGLLSRFNLTFDYDRRWLELEPRHG